MAENGDGRLKLAAFTMSQAKCEAVRGAASVAADEDCASFTAPSRFPHHGAYRFNCRRFTAYRQRCLLRRGIRRAAQELRRGPATWFMGISGSGNSRECATGHRVRPFRSDAGPSPSPPPMAANSARWRSSHPGPAPHMGRIEDAHMIVCHMIDTTSWKNKGCQHCTNS